MIENIASWLIDNDFLTNSSFRLSQSPNIFSVASFWREASCNSWAETNFSSSAKAHRIDCRFSSISAKSVLENATWKRLSVTSSWAETPITASLTSPFDKTAPHIMQVCPSTKEFFAHPGHSRCEQAVLYATPSTELLQKLHETIKVFFCMLLWSQSRATSICLSNVLNLKKELRLHQGLSTKTLSMYHFRTEGVDLKKREESNISICCCPATPIRIAWKNFSCTSALNSG